MNRRSIYYFRRKRNRKKLGVTSYVFNHMGTDIIKAGDPMMTFIFPIRGPLTYADGSIVPTKIPGSSCDSFMQPSRRGIYLKLSDAPELLAQIQQEHNDYISRQNDEA